MKVVPVPHGARGITRTVGLALGFRSGHNSFGISGRGTLALRRRSYRGGPLRPRTDECFLLHLFLKQMSLEKTRKNSKKKERKKMKNRENSVHAQAAISAFIYTFRYFCT